MTESDPNNTTVSNAGRSLLIFAALIIIMAGLKSAQAIVVPMLWLFLTPSPRTAVLVQSKGMSNGLH